MSDQTLKAQFPTPLHHSPALALLPPGRKSLSTLYRWLKHSYKLLNSSKFSPLLSKLPFRSKWEHIRLCMGIKYTFFNRTYNSDLFSLFLSSSPSHTLKGSFLTPVPAKLGLTVLASAHSVLLIDKYFGSQTFSNKHSVNGQGNCIQVCTTYPETMNSGKLRACN